VGSLLGRKLTERSEPLWLVLGAVGIAVSGAGIFFARTFAVILISLLVMGTSDGITIVAEQGIMMRRSPDAVRSRVMAGFDALLSMGIAIAYIFAGPALKLLGPQGVYGIGGISAAVAATILLPLLRLPREIAAGDRVEGLVAPPDMV
jgi:MFS family permease